MKLFKKTRLRKYFLCSLILSASATSSEFSYTGPELNLDYSGSLIIDNSQVKYTATDRLTFYTEDYLQQNIPKLLPLREAIDTWAAMQAIHPRLLSEVMNGYFKDKVVDDSFENKQMVFLIASGLSESFRENQEDVLAASKAVFAISNAFEFKLNLSTKFAGKRDMVEHDYFKGSAGSPLFSYFQPPWPRGELWAGGGAHTYTGGGSSARNSLDFFKTFISWGGDTSNVWISASQRGVVRVFSDCNINIVHPNGWVSSYYHLQNIIVTDSSTVGDNQRISNYADNLADATCQGGSSTNPHLHFSLYYDGDPIEIDQNNVDLSSWKHKVGEGNYDSNCSRSNYKVFPDGNTICPFSRQLPNNTTADDIFVNSFE